MAFTSKKDADAYDKMLDLADVLNEWLQYSTSAMEDDSRESLALWMAENKDTLSGILKNGKLPSLSDSEAPVNENITDYPGHNRREVA